MKTIFIVVGFINKTDELVELYETESEKNAENYKSKYQSRISIYNDFTIIKEKIPNEYKSFKEYKNRKIKKEIGT